MELTVKELATKERVTERTVYNWINKGAVDVRRTPGGNIRILRPPDMKSSENSGKSSK